MAVRVAMVSFTPRWPDRDANLAAMAAGLSTAVAAEAQVVLFPELCVSGLPRRWDAATLSAAAEAVPDGPMVARVVALARRHGVTLCAGLIEVSDGEFTITHVVCGPDGYLGKQAKLFPTRGRPRVDDITGGRRLVPLDLLGHRCAILACADWMLPEAIYLAALHEVELVLAPTDGYATADVDAMRTMVLTRVADVGAPIVVAYGGPASGDPIMAGLVLTPAGVLTHETRPPGESKVMTVDLALSPPPPRRFGGPRDRGPVLRDQLREYPFGQ